MFEMKNMAKPSENLRQDIFFEAPPAPRRGKKFFVALTIAVVLLAWSFHGAKIRLGELVEGIPQIGQTLARMLPPDFSKITEAKHYFFPENLSWAELLLPAPLGEADARVRRPAQPRTTLTRCVTPSSVSGIAAPSPSRARPSSSAETTPRLTPCGFSTTISYRAE